MITVSSWKLSRTTSLSNQANAAIDIAISQTQGLDQQYYQATNQTDEACFYVPEVNVNEAPVFRGQCDDNIVGVTNFNATWVSTYILKLSRRRKVTQTRNRS